MKQALELLEEIHPGNMTPMAEEAWKKAITALRFAIEQAEKQEPVAWQWLDSGTFRKSLPASAEPGAWRALYTTPPQRQPLTEEEISNAWNSAVRTASFEGNATKHFARAIERKHGIGGGE
jgi:hypothetical protein